MLLCQVKELLGAAIVGAHIVTESAAICHRRRGYYRRLRAAPRAQPSHKCSGVSSLAACPLHRSAPLRCAFTLSGTSSVLAADGSAGHELRPLRARLFCGRGRPFGSCPCRAARVAVPPLRQRLRRCLRASGGALGVPPPLPRVTGRRARAPAVRRRVPSRSVFRAAPLRSASPSALPLPAPLPPAPSGALALPRFLGCRSCRVPLALDARGPFALGFLGSGAHRLASARRFGVSVSPPEPFFCLSACVPFGAASAIVLVPRMVHPPAPHTEGSEAQKYQMPLSRPRAICA